MMEAWRGTGDPRVASPIIYEGRRRLALQHSTGAERRAGAPHRGLWELRPYEEAGAPSTGGWVVPAPPGVVMVAPLEVPRNAESVRSERPRWKWGSKSAARGIIEAGVLRGSGPEQRRYSSLASRAESSCTCLYSSSLARRSSSS